MPQETNLNVAPYFDDFDPANNYYKVLFKPAFPVQARELNNVQSILQNQIERFGTHTFKEGAKVIPGQLTYLNNYDAVEIDPTYLGVPVQLYLDQLIGKGITGQTSGITAKVVNYITNEESERGTYTLYVNYIDSSSTDLESGRFFDDEVLTTDNLISFATTFIGEGEGFSKTINQGATSVGSAFAISNGVYFLRGYFVEVADQTLILDQYSNLPSYRVGLNVIEEVVSSDSDRTLTDNAQGFNNFTSPGADRLRIVASLAKKSPNDFNDVNFVQLAEVKEGVLRELNINTEYNYLGDELARRTFDESGNYYIREFATSVKESLNDGLGNRGIYTEDQTTDQGNSPSDDLAVYKISPGKAYVKGYEVQTIAPTLIDIEKPRTTKTIESQSVNFNFGPSFTVNNVYGSPTLGFDSTNVISFRSERVGTDPKVASGKEIAVGRIYDFALESGSYDTTTPDLNKWDTSFFDVQAYTELQLSESSTLNVPVYIRGENSGASAYLRHSVVGTSLTAYDVQGEFIIGERVTFSGVDGGRTVTGVKNYEISDAQSLFGTVGGASTFSADIIQSPQTVIGIASISQGSGGVSTVTSPSVIFTGIATAGNLVQYSVPENDVPSLARVTSVNTNSMSIESVENIDRYRVGDLPSSNVSVTDLTLVTAQTQGIQAQSNLAPTDTLFSIFPKKNVSSVDLTTSSLVIRRSYTVNITDGSTNSISTNDNETFLNFDEERYTLIRSDGQTEELTPDRFNFGTGNTTLSINNLGSNDTGASLVTTILKSKITSKLKVKNNTNSITITQSADAGSGVGGTTLNDGLTYGDYPFGTRVQDEVISLNTPDVMKLHGVFESNDLLDPKPPSMSLGSLDGPNATTNDLIVGEMIVGTVSGARALYVQRDTDTNIYYINKNKTSFDLNEVVEFKTSGVRGTISLLSPGSKNITKSYTLSKSDRINFYDISRIVRNADTPAPTGKLRIFFADASYEDSDTGDITTVNSYKNFDYSTEIGKVQGNVRQSDIVDARPRVSTFTTTEGSRSPFEFYGRSFDGGQHSSAEILATDESLRLGFSYYLPRMDRLFVSPEGEFIVKKGIPADNPQYPDPIPNTLNIANVALPAYLYDVKNAAITFIEHKRYQMSDISKLEQRIRNLEYYSSLNSLEQSTLNQFVADANGLDRFKSGVFVDNFQTVTTQDPTIGVRNSIDKKNQVLRPSHYTTNVNLQIGNTTIAGVGTTSNLNQDSRYADVLGTNISRDDNQVCLEFSEVVWLSQEFATRVENVTPYLVTFWTGRISMNPNSDVWIEVNEVEANEVIIDGDFNDVVEDLSAEFGEIELTTDEDGLRSGVSPINWESWETTGVQVSQDRNTRSGVSGNTAWSTTTTTTTTVRDQERDGTQVILNERLDTQSLGSFVTSREIIHFMRSRNVECTATSMKPFTRVYSFFDSVDVNTFCNSKLLEISMASGTFQIGETVTGVMPTAEDVENVDDSTIASITFRVANPNHKYGPYNNPTDFFVKSPYDRNVTIPSTYSETSSLLNIDTFSLASEESPQFSGYVSTGMILRGESSGAEATIIGNRLVTDQVGTLIYNYLVPPSNNPVNPTFETGQSRMRLTNSSTNSRVAGTFNTSAEATFYSQGSIDNTQESTLSVRNAEVSFDDSFQDTRVTTTVTTSRNTTTRQIRRPDPLAQTFFVDDETGVFLSSIDIFFQGKPADGAPPCVLSIREVELGTPTQKILPFSEVDISPSDITASDDASIVTNVEFQSPVYLKGQTEYAIVLLSHSTEYTVWISRMGEVEISTQGQESGQILVSEQPLLGSLFKSQNASTWTPSQYEDLKFTLYRADFELSGSVEFFNPNLPQSLEVIPEDNVAMSSRSIRVGLGTTVHNLDIEPGNTIEQGNSGATGDFVGYGGSATSGLTIINSGIGYTPSSGELTYSNVSLITVTGSGLNATADITISDGVAIAATINNGGQGYRVGDLIRPTSIGNQNLGNNIQLSISEVYGNNELFINNVQGNFTTNSSDLLLFTNSSGITTEINYFQGSVFPQSPITVVEDGLHMNVFFRNHAMHSKTNIVTISGLEGEVGSTTLNAEYAIDTSGLIAIASTENFGTFEGVGVAVTNPGYVKIGDEIISYTGFDGTALDGITRGVDNTPIQRHTINNIVKLYEMNGVSLRRINRTHSLNLADNDKLNTLDSYYIKIDTADTDYGTNRSASSEFPILYWNRSKSGGGKHGKSTYNVQFEQIVPNFTYITPTGTSLDASLRTVSGTSVSGDEVSFEDKGFESITLKTNNYFDSPRLICSKDNEDTFLGELPGNKSVDMNIIMTSSDSRLSPMIDLSRTSLVLISNRVNSVVTDYADDFKVKTVPDDPSRFFYVTKNIILENPATSIQVLMDAYVNEASDIRCFYAFDQDVPADETIFIPFPGFKNQDPSGRPGVIASQNLSDGSSDQKVGKTDSIIPTPSIDLFSEYKFSVDNLPEFTKFRIKVIGTSRNQAAVPQITNLRVMSLA